MHRAVVCRASRSPSPPISSGAPATPRRLEARRRLLPVNAARWRHLSFGGAGGVPEAVRSVEDGGAALLTQALCAPAPSRHDPGRTTEELRGHGVTSAAADASGAGSSLLHVVRPKAPVAVARWTCLARTARVQLAVPPFSPRVTLTTGEAPNGTLKVFLHGRRALLTLSALPPPAPAVGDVGRALAEHLMNHLGTGRGRPLVHRVVIGAEDSVGDEHAACEPESRGDGDATTVDAVVVRGPGRPLWRPGFRNHPVLSSLRWSAWPRFLPM